ncbi:MAG: hypothetical protein PHG14_14950 [Desulfobacter postgatei]|uniref:A1S_2505 family phage non-structural protein n=1 Tax=Desulfobacter postgatei TaxID=2293 RepID=UPI0023F4CF5C|nr:hypothetical protein [Desulfobacter postgatei]MDD4275011.1 hypothetical protein [Desulfobacter postgatei]
MIFPDYVLILHTSVQNSFKNSYMENYYTEEELHWCRGGNTGMLPGRITPSVVNVLKPGEMFVFGSNFGGNHLGGAALVAKNKFGAVLGIGEGLQGRSYAIPTMEGLQNMIPAIERFTSFAKQHQELKFFVTAIGCGIAGYLAEEVAPYFLEAAYLPNVYLPLSFFKVLQEISYTKEDVHRVAEMIIELCSYMHKHNLPDWNDHTDETIFNSLERDQMWQLGILLKVISPGEKEPPIKALPDALQKRILSQLKSL